MVTASTISYVFTYHYLRQERYIFKDNYVNTCTPCVTTCTTFTHRSVESNIFSWLASNSQELAIIMDIGATLAKVFYFATYSL